MISRTYLSTEEELIAAIVAAVKSGYRMIDTASFYISIGSPLLRILHSAQEPEGSGQGNQEVHRGGTCEA